MTYNDALKYIHSLGTFVGRPGLERIKTVMEKLGNVQNKLKFIHIAGTNGKGSTAAMLSNIYTKAGYKTGLFVSPYIIDFRERIQFCGEYISKRDLSRLCNRVKSQNVTLSEFEFITAIAFLYFFEKKCDIVILETGLGGRFDATNIIDNPLCCIITQIDLDHTKVLGNKVEQIAFEKCGIIKKDAVVITDIMQNKAAIPVIKSSTNNLILPNTDDLNIISSDINGNTFIYKDEQFKTRLAGKHQVFNAVSAIEAVRNINIKVEDTVLESAIENTFFPARLEVISQNPVVILDGAHNPNGAQVLSRFMQNYSGKITAIIGMMSDKNCEEVLKTTLCHCQNVVCTCVQGNSRSISEQELCFIAKKYCDKVSVASDYKSAVSLALNISNGNPLFVFGSLYLASDIRQMLLSETNRKFDK